MCHEPCPYRRRLLLRQIQGVTQGLAALVSAVCSNRVPSATPHPDNQIHQTVIPKRELGRYDGRNGAPAYVAVNTIVYDVTNDPAWAAGSHFGLTAGRDLSGQYSACHGGQPILEKLPVAGRLGG
ncbi:cytochrome B5 [Heliobacterium undosum]|uniref:Cytochrome B5 n=2 Tax=Heliomicrobium undosum TaxID=121734 RepID=A0A845L7J0_9FIRM|nr:cytochrome B5 [Heliomicrobium undosum]